MTFATDAHITVFVTVAGFDLCLGHGTYNKPQRARIGFDSLTTELAGHEFEVKLTESDDMLVVTIDDELDVVLKQKSDDRYFGYITPIEKAAPATLAEARKAMAKAGMAKARKASAK